MRRLLVLFSAVLLCCLPVMMNAQSASSATITGQVADPQGAVIVGARITATNVATGVAHTAKTTSSGNYNIPNLPPGVYNLKSEAQKFPTGEGKGIKLTIAHRPHL